MSLIDRAGLRFCCVPSHFVRRKWGNRKHARGSNPPICFPQKGLEKRRPTGTGAPLLLLLQTGFPKPQVSLSLFASPSSSQACLSSLPGLIFGSYFAITEPISRRLLPCHPSVQAVSFCCGFMVSGFRLAKVNRHWPEFSLKGSRRAGGGPPFRSCRRFFGLSRFQNNISAVPRLLSSLFSGDCPFGLRGVLL